MKIGHQPDGCPAAVCVSSSSTPILTDERPPLGADGPLRSIEIPSKLSISSQTIHISARDRLSQRSAISFHRPVKNVHLNTEVTDSSRVVAGSPDGTNGDCNVPRI
jgi:hypothetical protein